MVRSSNTDESEVDGLQGKWIIGINGLQVKWIIEENGLQGEMDYKVNEL